MNRYYLAPDQWTQDVLLLHGEEARHCAQVMRESVGSRIEVFDGCGRSAVGEIQQSSRSEVAVKIETSQVTEPATPQIILYCAIPKGKTMDWIVQKAVELGANRIVPLQTTNTVVKLDAKDAAKKVAKWQRTALEACKQCGQDYLVEIGAVRHVFDLDVLEGIGLVGSLEADSLPLRERIGGLDVAWQISLFVGPEGDFSRDEYQALYDLGALPTSLGDLVLRVETAAFALVGSVSLFLRGSND